MVKFTSYRSAACAACLAALGAAAPAWADDTRIDEAWKAALSQEQGVLNEQQHALVNSIAYSAAAALLCDGIDIDEQKVATGINGVLADGPKDLTNDEQIARYTEIILTLGTAKGILLAEGALHKADFCANAMAEKSHTDVANFWK